MDGQTCTNCGKAPRTGRRLCAGCGSGDAAYRAARRRRLREAGLCIECGMEPPRDGRRMCAGCAGRHSAWGHLRRDGLTAAGICYVCKRTPRVPANAGEEDVPEMRRRDRGVRQEAGRRVGGRRQVH